MKTYTIATECTLLSNYTVEANSQEEAEERFWDGNYKTSIDTDYQNEEIVEIVEIVENN